MDRRTGERGVRYYRTDRHGVQHATGPPFDFEGYCLLTILIPLTAVTLFAIISLFGGH